CALPIFPDLGDRRAVHARDDPAGDAGRRAGCRSARLGAVLSARARRSAPQGQEPELDAGVSLRADRTSTGEQSVQVPDLLGGLHTHVPPHRVPPNASPELNNVLLSRGAVEKRGAMVPLVRQQPGACALQNKGWHQRSRSHSAIGTIEVPFVTVPGCAHAGHRSAWDDADVRNGITLDLFLEVDDLTTHHGGNGTDTATVYGPSPYKVWFRPILSKGPIRRTAEPGAPSMTGTPGWQTTSRWGPISAAHHAMPFCLYLRNNGPINNPSWRIGFAFHWSDGANRSEEHTSELQSRENHVCRLLLEKKKHESSFLPFNS